MENPMQASQPSNDTRLPRQVLRRSAAIQARIDAAKAESNADPAANTPPATPSVSTATTADAPPVDPPVADPRENDPAYWKQRFRVTQGVVTSLKEAHQVEVTELKRQVSELTEQVQAMQASAPPAPIDLSEFLSQEQIDAMGAEEAQTIVNTALTAARTEVGKLVEKELKPLRDANARQAATAQKQREREFKEALTALVSDWEQYDQTEAMDEWLADVDESSGLVRNEILLRHIGRASVQGVAGVFNAYKATLRKVPAPPVAPNGSGAGPGNTPMPASMHPLQRPSADEIKAFYKRAATLRKGQPGHVTDQERVEFEKRMKLR